MFFFQCIQNFFTKTSDISNQILSLDNNNIKEELLEKYLDVSNNSELIFEKDVDPLIMKSKEVITNTQSKKQKLLNYFKKNIFVNTCRSKKNEIQHSISETKELLHQTKEQLEEVKEQSENNLKNCLDEFTEKVSETVDNSNLQQLVNDLNDIISKKEIVLSLDDETNTILTELNNIINDNEEQPTEVNEVVETK